MSSMPVVIAGMHRSGTSLVTRALNVCGLYLGPENELIQPSSDNPKGYWENLRFVRINDAVLQALGGAWDVIPVLDAGWERREALEPLRKMAAELVSEMNNHASWGWKDPRNSLTFPFWESLIDGLKVVICVRNPIDVIQSLSHRGHSSREFGQRLWLDYNRQILKTSGPGKRIITHFETYFEDPIAELKTLTSFLGFEVTDGQLQAAVETISSSARNHDSSDARLLESGLSGKTIALYRSLREETGPLPVSVIDDKQSSNAIRSGMGAQSGDSVEFLRAEREALLIKLSQKEEVEKKLANREANLNRLREQHWNLQDRLRIRDKRFYRLREQHAELAARYHELNGTLAVRLQRMYWRLRDRILPSGSRVRRAYDLLVKGLRTIAGHGLSEFWQQLKRFSSPFFDRRGRSGVRRAQARRLQSSSKLNGAPYALAYEEMLSTAQAGKGKDYVGLTDLNLQRQDLPVRLIAFYLPQFHPIPENDEWWGKGFTEWSNVPKAVPQFVGHYQPHLPDELGFYDLRVAEVQDRQIELARNYGIYGFCFHYYWFSGKRLLERPLDMFLSRSELDFPFCICWANENWTRRWDGAEHEILIAQEHSLRNDQAFIEDLAPILRDQRYITIHGRPVLIVYRAPLLPQPKKTAELWKEFCVREGIAEPYLVAAQTFRFEDPRTIGFDAAVRFPPHNSKPRVITRHVDLLNPDYQGVVHDYVELVDRMSRESYQDSPFELFMTVMPQWDNEPRNPSRGRTFANSTPDVYEQWVRSACQDALKKDDPEKRLVFINAWNEWAEGAHLEPDRRYGYAYLHATANGLRTAAGLPTVAAPYVSRSLSLVSEHGAPIIVYQMGRVGSRTIYESLRHHDLEAPVHHVHMLNKLDEIEAEVLQTRANPGNSLKAIRDGRQLRAMIDQDPDQPLNIISMVRNPVDRNVSAFFWNLDEFIPDALARYNNGDLSIQEMREAFLQGFLHNAPADWFDSQVRDLFGIDVFDAPFPFDQGYQIYENQSVKLLVMRLEDMNACAKQAMHEFLGIRNFKLMTVNRAQDYPYREAYKAFKEFGLPPEYVAEMHSSRLAKRFYSDAELAVLQELWTDGS